MKRSANAAVATMLVIWTSVLACGGMTATAYGVKAVKARRGRCRGAYLMPTEANVSRVVAATLCLVDREREGHHLQPLRSNGFLQRMALGQADDMVTGDYFGDNSLTGMTPWQRITASRYARGARRLTAGQNIGWGTGGLATPAAMVAAWMRSAPHREIMLSGAYRDVGVGVAPAAPRRMAGGMRGATYTAVFAAKG
jgi:uncharacterized protein YkwD